MRSQRVGARIGVFHVEGQVVRLRSRESDRVVDAEELIEEARTFAAWDVAAAAAGVVVGVERHGRMRVCGFGRRILLNEILIEAGSSKGV